MQRANYIFEGTMTAEQPLATCSAALNEAYGAKGKPLPVPFIDTPKGRRLMFPASGIRGKLRRALRDVLRAKLIERTGNEKPLSLDEHYLLTLGGIKGKGDTDRSTVAMEKQWRESNVLLSLFGAGDAGVLGFMQGRLAIGNAICSDVSEPAIFSGARTDDLYRDKGQIAYLSDEDVELLISRAKGNRDASVVKRDLAAKEKALKVAQRAKDDELSQSLSAEVDALKAEIDSIKTQSGAGDNSVGMPLAGWQAIPQGAVMEHRFILAGGTQVELGALLAALGQFSSLPVLGAHFAAGCGLVSGEWEVFKVQYGTGKTSLGKVLLKPFECVPVIEAQADSELFGAIQAFEGYLNSESFDLSIPSA
ncbi:hypothetical protein [Stutzerimonas stutzeri]|uniref:hypothetical protein n=1 Tax=Stutzerimonas stutzeri TaxID=316 RepID=UPI00265CFBA3|nr:hypothetical protein [Stutzerimonas stutzeri]MCF6783736.1 hypothetical protein [Stutzerimonas stutzeri]